MMKPKSEVSAAEIERRLAEAHAVLPALELNCGNLALAVEIGESTAADVARAFADLRRGQEYRQ
jgi:hypothetical protein